MKLAAAYAIARSVENPTKDMVIPSALDTSLGDVVAKAVEQAVYKDREMEKKIAAAEAEYTDD